MSNKWIKSGDIYSDQQIHLVRSSGTNICLIVTKYHSNNSSSNAKLPLRLVSYVLWVLVFGVYFIEVMQGAFPSHAHKILSG